MRLISWIKLMRQIDEVNKFDEMYVNRSFNYDEETSKKIKLRRNFRKERKWLIFFKQIIANKFTDYFYFSHLLQKKKIFFHEKTKS